MVARCASASARLPRGAARRCRDRAPHAAGRPATGRAERTADERSCVPAVAASSCAAGGSASPRGSAVR